MVRGSLIRVVLVSVLMVLVAAPMYAAFAAPAPERHGCCRQGDAVQVPSDRDCCVISGRPSPPQQATAPMSAGVAEHVFVTVEGAIASNDHTSGFVTASELTPSPPTGPHGSSLLRI